MPYIKNNPPWQPGVTPITADRLNHMETQYDAAAADLAAKMDPDTGHKHTGTAGDGPPIPLSGIDAAAKTSPGGTEPNRIAVTGDDGAVGLARGVPVVSGQLPPAGNPGHLVFDRENYSLRVDDGVAFKRVVVTDELDYYVFAGYPLKVAFKTGLTLTTPGTTGWQKLTTITFDYPFSAVPFVVAVVNGGVDTVNRLAPNSVTTTKFDLYGYVEKPNSPIWWSYLAIGQR